MVLTRPLLYALAGLISLTSAAPLDKRIAQVISESTQQWVQACTAAGGADKCGTTSQTAFMTLLAAAGDCDQQNAADSMIDLAKSLNNDPKMISLAQIFAQQPRNSPNKLSVNYCQQQSKNSELNGLFQCQFQGVDSQTFTNNIQVGRPGTAPLGFSAPLSPPGSCKAHPHGGIADGTQLVALTQDPGLTNAIGAGASAFSSIPSTVGSSSNSTNAPAGPTVTLTESIVTVTVEASAIPTGCGSSATPTDSGTNDTSSQSAIITLAGASASDSAGSVASMTASASNPSAPGNFRLQNGKDAQALNAKFATLTSASSCNEGDQACISNDFAQCVGGKFVITQCAAGTQCFALPLVNKAGTSLACTTLSDATSRIQATGAPGNVTSA